MITFGHRGSSMEAVIDSVAVQVQHQPQQAASTSDKMRIVADCKRDLDDMIQAELQRGWVLISRGYSLDEGHGATLIRKDLEKTA